MKLNIKTIKGETFVIEAEKKDTVGDVKKKIFEAKAVEVATQKLIFKGMQLADEKNLEDCGVNDGDMMVMMSVKKVANVQPVQAQPQQQQQQLPASNNAAPQLPVQQAQPVQGPANQGGLGVSVLSQEQFNKTVDDIVGMGFSRQEAIVALQAAYNNPDRAIDYLLNGMPQNTNPAMFGAEEYDEDSDSGSPELNFGGGAGSGGAGLGLPNSQMLSQLRAAIQQDPSVLQQILSQLATTNPQLYQLIQQHPSEFMNLLNSVEDSGNAGGEEGDELEDDEYDEVQVPAQITPQDNAAIERLCGLGFDRAQALEAFVACEKDENMAANYLLEWSLRGENPPGQNNQNAPPGGNNPGQN